LQKKRDGLLQEQQPLSLVNGHWMKKETRGWLRFPSFSFPRKKEAVAGATASFHFKLVGLCGFEP
jgi:hypothetical protein